MEFFIVKARGIPGRFLVERNGMCFDGRKIGTARQEKYGNRPDVETGLYLGEQWYSFDASRLISLKPFKAKAGV